VVLLVDSTFNDLHGMCGCGMRYFQAHEPLTFPLSLISDCGVRGHTLWPWKPPGQRHARSHCPCVPVRARHVTLAVSSRRHGPGPCVLWDASREAEGTDLRQFDWVVFGLVDRPEFDLRHVRCPFLSAAPNHTRHAAAEPKGEAGEGIGGEAIADDADVRELEIDAIVVTDRELAYDLDRAATQAILRAPWTRGLDRLSFHHAVTVAWILEPPVISSSSYEQVRRKAASFDLVFSHNKPFLAELPDGRGRYVPLATCLIPAHQRAMHHKTKLVSILASARAHAPGHQLRHAIVSSLANRPVGPPDAGYVLDAFGQAFDGQVCRRICLRNVHTYTHTHTHTHTYIHRHTYICTPFTLLALPVKWTRER
jgi:hypothetical protein